MPRTYDFSADRDAVKNAYAEEGSLFARHATARTGRSEVALLDLWGPGHAGFLKGPRHQFSLDAPKDVTPYDNGLVDPAFDWLEDNAAGKWNWLERVVNHGRGLQTHVYVETPDDRAAFMARWGHLFKASENAIEHNRRLEEGSAASPAP